MNVIASHPGIFLAGSILLALILFGVNLVLYSLLWTSDRVSERTTATLHFVFAGIAAVIVAFQVIAFSPFVDDHHYHVIGGISGSITGLLVLYAGANTVWGFKELRQQDKLRRLTAI